jgi:hypothetical protein
MTIRCVKIQCAGDIVEVAERKKLDTVLVLLSLKGDTRGESNNDCGNSSATVMIRRTFILRCCGVAEGFMLTGN